MVIDGGYFTMMKYVRGLGPRDLERTVGFHSGRLKEGYIVAVLDTAETIGPDDFALAASTRWSGGKVGPKDGPTADINDILAKRDQSPDELRKKVAKFFTLHVGNRPAKILPNLRDDGTMTYPDAEARPTGERNGVPQFILRKPKNFAIFEKVGAN